MGSNPTWNSEFFLVDVISKFNTTILYHEKHSEYKVIVIFLKRLGPLSPFLMFKLKIPPFNLST